MEFTKTTLSNGLDVVVHEDHHAPLVAVSLWYHVGSRHEVEGRTGLAHLFEHLMFEGGVHQPRGYFEPLQSAGVSLNGSTSADRTNYWEVGPASTTALSLWMEADRMGWLLPAVTESRFNTQRDVVLNERRQNYENRPYGLAQFAVSEAIFPRGHSYRWPTIGAPDDLRATSLEEIHDFFRRFYHPGNASLAIAGDIETARALDLVHAMFDEIPAGPRIQPTVAPPVQAQPRRLMLTDRVELPRLYLVWPSAALFAPDDAELDLAADLLANGRTARLYRKLVHEARIATELAAAQSSRELGGMFQILATAAPGHTLIELEDAIADALHELADRGPTSEELERSRVQAEAAFTYRLRTLGGFGGRADQLNAYNVYRGTPDGFEHDLQRYLNATSESVRAAVRRWIDPARAVALSVVPIGQEARALPESERCRPS
jgi:zinc protease